MRYFISAISMCGACMMTALGVNAQEAKVFKASSAWALDYGDDYCRLMRDFKSGDETVGLFVERTQPGPTMRMIVIGDSVKLFRGSEEVGYRMYPAGAPRIAQRLRFQTSDGQQYLNLGPSTFADMAPPVPGAPPIIPPPYSPQGEKALASGITGISLERGLTQPVILETGELGSAAEALQACADDLIASWGLDAEKHQALTRPAMPERATAGWISGDTILFGDFAKLSGGNNEVRVMVDEAGKAKSCHIQWPTLSEAINMKICSSVMANSSFMPALDAAGQPLASYWTASAFFLIPPFGS
ncbi:MAG: hypothetical protein EON58_14185 [Alphaproteobacteria bacterium]|nr:MAG: hypothetical protein EON58_14185 [Alphaproteobacteria bacterium]